MIAQFFGFLCLVLLTACGYHLERGEKIAISVPYVINDFEGALTEELARAISRTANFKYSKDDGDWILKAKILRTNNDRIGFRYDRDDRSGKRRDNIIGTENRKEITVEVCVIDATTDKMIAGPQVIKADAMYDYVDPNSLRDLSFIDPDTGRRVTSISFSLGQLDSVGTAGEDATYPVFRLLAQKIVDGLIASGEDGE
ncbi:MAG: hypothetical protein JSS30_07765 [Verrucomicrobia bacterium]|nr:hypothetical protein [Verrucomicrobiota bacterium]